MGSNYFFFHFLFFLACSIRYTKMDKKVKVSVNQWSGEALCHTENKKSRGKLRRFHASKTGKSTSKQFRKRIMKLIGLNTKKMTPQCQPSPSPSSGAPQPSSSTNLQTRNKNRPKTRFTQILKRVAFKLRFQIFSKLF